MYQALGSIHTDILAPSVVLANIIPDMEPIGKYDTFRLLAQTNLNHLLYFWAVGQTLSITAAATRLGVSQPSVSERVKTLENRLGTRLIERGPRGVSLTTAGRVAMRFAEEAVGVCSELVRSLPLDHAEAARPLMVGTADAVPKIIVRRILEPLLNTGDARGTRAVCREWRVDHLMAELSLHRLDIVISDTPPAYPTDKEDEQESLRSYPAGSTAVDFFAAPGLVRRARRLLADDPSRVPMLMPAENAPLRLSLNRWFMLRGASPLVVIEAEDRAMLHHFAEAGYGVVPVATATSRDIARQFGLLRVGHASDVHEHYYITVMHHRYSHPAINIILEKLIDDKRRRSTPRTKRN